MPITVQDRSEKEERQTSDPQTKGKMPEHDNCQDEAFVSSFVYPWQFVSSYAVSDLLVSEEGSLLNGNMTYTLTAGFDTELQIQGSGTEANFFSYTLKKLKYETFSRGHRKYSVTLSGLFRSLSEIGTLTVEEVESFVNPVPSFVKLMLNLEEYRT
ncbi:hypothetical protein STEG23_010860 [Scotinomys teguina]